MKNIKRTETQLELVVMELVKQYGVERIVDTVYKNYKVKKRTKLTNKFKARSNTSLCYKKN